MGGHNIHTYLQDINFHLQRLDSVTPQDWIYLIRITSSLETFFRYRNESDMEENIKFKALFLWKLHLVLNHYLGLMDCPHTMTNRQIRDLVIKVYNKQRAAPEKAPKAATIYSQCPEKSSTYQALPLVWLCEEQTCQPETPTKPSNVTPNQHDKSCLLPDSPCHMSRTRPQTR